jgi:glycosyltransferase involved in cell wall biosynthesis
MTSPPSSRRRLVHVLHYDGPGGGPTCVSELLDMWSGEYDQAVITGGKGPLSRFCAQRGIPCHDVGLHRLWMLPLSLIRMGILFRGYRPDAAILAGQWAGFAGAIVARLLRVRAVVYVVHFSFLYTDWSIYRVIRNRIVEKVPCALSHRVVLLSPGSRYQYMIRNIVPIEKSRLIPNAFNQRRTPAPERAADVRKRFGWDAGICHVLSIGRLEDQKRVDWLLRSWALVEPQAPSAHLWIVGSGRQEKDLRALAGRLALKQCTFLGDQPGGIDFVAAADVIAMTTMYEMHAIVPLEAMACGKPIVASSADGVGFTFRHEVEGLLVPPGDIQGFASSLLTLTGDEGLRLRMGDAGRKRVQLFSPERLLASFKDLFTELKVGPN